MPFVTDTVQKSRLRKVVVHLAKLAFGVAICAFLVYKYDWRQVLEPILNARWDSIALAWCFAIVALASYAAMNRVALRPLKMPLTVLQILKILFQIRFFALFLPGGSNFFVKWYKFSKPGKQPAQALALMLYSRVLHLFALLFLAMMGVWCDRLFPWPPVRWLMLAVFILTTLVLIALMSRTLLAIIVPALRVPWQALPVPAFARAKLEKLGMFSTAFQHFTKREAAGVLLFAVGGNFFETVQHFFIAQAVGLDLSLFTFMWLRGIMVLCGILPISLSGLGLREASLVAVLIHYGVAEPDALAYSLLFYGMFLLGKGLIGGGAELWDWLVPELLGKKTGDGHTGLEP